MNNRTQQRFDATIRAAVRQTEQLRQCEADERLAYRHAKARRLLPGIRRALRDVAPLTDVQRTILQDLQREYSELIGADGSVSRDTPQHPVPTQGSGSAVRSENDNPSPSAITSESSTSETGQGTELITRDREGHAND